MKRNTRYTTIKVRFIQLISVSIVMCLILISFVTWFSWSVAQRSREEQVMKAFLQDMANQADAEYNEILKLSQNMVPTGQIGQIYDEYLNQKTQYDRFKSYSDFTNSLNIATFGMEEILLSAYYIPESEEQKQEILFSSFSVREGFEPENTQELSRTNEIIFQPLHDTRHSALIKDVFSILRPVTFSNGVNASIYLEIKSSVLSIVRDKEEIEKIPYVFLQTDPQGKIVYSSEAFSIGEQVTADEEGIVHLNQYTGVQRQSSYGFFYVLLMPSGVFAHRNNQWLLWILVVVLISFTFLAVVSFLQIWFFQHPLAALEKEMDSFDGSTFKVSVYRGNLKEFDRVYGAFNRMKEEIQSLIAKNQQQMEEKTLLELEKLKYQINPHFLMNALNTVRWMSVVHKTDDITSYVTHLGYILSYSLGKIDYETTLRTELRVLENYLKLQQTTYDFEYVLDVEEGEYLEQPCARFLLQPVAENSVCHNMDEFGHLWIKVRREEGNVHISLEDDGKGFAQPAETEEGKEIKGQKNRGIGLRYLKMTLDAVYGKRAELRIDSVVGEGTTVHILIPEGEKDVQGSDCG